MIFSAIIVNYNTKELVENCLNSIFTHCDDGSFEIIVIDNASQDGSVEMFKNNFKDKVKLIANSRNAGFGSANNQGAKIARGEYLFFLNSDTIIKNNILVELEKSFLRDENIGAVAPKLFLEDGGEQPYAFGNFPSLASAVFEKFKSSAKYRSNPFEVDWASGAALAVKKNVFEKLGGFDKKFFMYFEDIDLCKRIKEAGYKILVNPRASLTHLCGKSLSRFIKRKRYYYESQDYFYKKHYGSFKMYLMKIIRWPYKVLITFVKIN